MLFHSLTRVENPPSLRGVRKLKTALNRLRRENKEAVDMGAVEGAGRPRDPTQAAAPAVSGARTPTPAAETQCSLPDPQFRQALKAAKGLTAGPQTPLLANF